MLTLQQLKDLDAIVTHGGFRAAARAIDVSQAGLTKSIAKLESDYRVSLLERQATGVGLTEEGKTFIRYARTVILDVQKAEQCLREFRAKSRPSIRLGVSIEPSLTFVPAVLADFRRRCPGVTLHLTHGVMADLLDAVREGRVDTIVSRLSSNFEEHGLLVNELYSTELAIIGRTGHPLCQAKIINDLSECDWLVVGDPARDPIQDACIIDLFLSKNLEPPRSTSISESLFSVMSLLMTSNSIARLPRSIINHPLAKGLLQEILISDVNSLCHIGLVRKRNLLPGADLQTLIAMINSYARISHFTSIPTDLQIVI